jgi:hypothetical protein
MVKTQIQIPGHLFQEAKRIAGECEMSFAQVVRMGLNWGQGSFFSISFPLLPWQLFNPNPADLTAD